MYDDYILKLSEKIQRYFAAIQGQYNFDKGPEFEVALCRVLRRFLPIKYGICRGFVVDLNGDKEGDDIIIFDQERFPTLRLLAKEDYSIKEQIPIEAIYAYVEAKHRLTPKSFAKSIRQIVAVKRLCLTRPKMGLYQADPYIGPDSRMTYISPSLPDFRNPVFTMVFSLFSDEMDSGDRNDGSRINSFLSAQLNALALSSDDQLLLPELVVAGKSNFLSTAYVDDNGNKPTLFHLGYKTTVAYQVVERRELAFGIAFTHLMAAIDWIRLGKMPWENMLNESKGQGRD